MWLLWQGKNLRQYRFLKWTLLIGQSVHPLGGVDGRNLIFVSNKFYFIRVIMINKIQVKIQIVHIIIVKKLILR